MKRKTAFFYNYPPVVHAGISTSTRRTWPEPPPAESPLWTLSNLLISPHIGGTIGDEVVRLADCVIAEFEAWSAGRPLRHQVTQEILATMG